MTNLRPTLSRLAATLLAATAPLAQAHEGHGMPGISHWHASDVLGFAAVVGVLLAVTWFKGGKK